MMALLVMGIGLVSVITLFPISLLRSIEATKLTNATLLSQNANARIKASFSVGTGEIVESGAIIKDPDADGDSAEHIGEYFVVDPLGAWTLAGDGVAPSLGPGFAPDTRAFANITAISNGDGLIDINDEFPPLFRDANGDNTPDPILRYTFGLNQAEAEAFVTLPDSFNTIFDGIAGTFTYVPPTTTPPEPAKIMLDGVGEYALNEPVRVTAFDSAARGSTIVNGAIGIDTDGDGILDALTGVTLGGSLSPTTDHVVVDIKERRYTWIATVNNEGTSPIASIAVFFRRSFSVEDEKAFTVTEPAGSYNVFEMDMAAHGITKDPVTRDYLGEPPGFEQGGWMFDLNSFRWWKISAIQYDDAAGLIRFATDPAETMDGDTKLRTLKAIFPRNVVEVYALDQSGEVE